VKEHIDPALKEVAVKDTFLFYCHRDLGSPFLREHGEPATQKYVGSWNEEVRGMVQLLGSVRIAGSRTGR
jgi:hypothetical protein